MATISPKTSTNKRKRVLGGNVTDENIAEQFFDFDESLLEPKLTPEQETLQREGINITTKPVISLPKAPEEEPEPEPKAKSGAEIEGDLIRARFGIGANIPLSELRQEGEGLKEFNLRIRPSERELNTAQLQEQQRIQLLQRTREGQIAMQLFRQFQGRPLPQEVLATLTPTEIDAYQAFAAGGFSAGVGAGAGAVAGAIGGAGVGAVAGGVIGGVGGIITGVRSNIANQLQGELSARAIELREGEQNMRSILTDINQGGNVVQDTQLFYENLAAIQRSHAQLKLDTERDLAKFTGKDGTTQLTRYELFFERTLPLLENELQQAILNPNPNKILVTANELNLDLENEE